MTCFLILGPDRDAKDEHVYGKGGSEKKKKKTDLVLG